MSASGDSLDSHIIFWDHCVSSKGLYCTSGAVWAAVGGLRSGGCWHDERSGVRGQPSEDDW